MTRLIDMTGQKHNRLLVLRRDCLAYTKQACWRCLCDCGEETVQTGQNIRSGIVVSCGCKKAEYASERSLTHGESHGSAGGRSLEYTCWANMHARCIPNSKRKDRHIYSERGISVCDRWHSFELFLEDMGRKPSTRHSIDRIDNEGNYEPGNCRWAVPVVQRRNQRFINLVTYRGEEMFFVDAWRMAGEVIDFRQGLTRYTRLGWSIEDAIETPPLRSTGRRKAGSRYAS